MSFTNSNEPRDPSPINTSGSARFAPPAVIGLLATALIAFGMAPTLLPESYSWTEHGISESAAQGVDGAWPARMGMILFGLAVVWLVALRHSSWGRLATVLHLAFGVSMFGVAAFAAKSWEQGAAFVESEDALHSVFANTAGFGFVGAMVVLIIQRRQRSIRVAAPDWVALVVTATVPLAYSTSVWGLLQRLMFCTAAAWYAWEALRQRNVWGIEVDHPTALN